MSHYDISTDTERLEIIFGDDTELDRVQKFMPGDEGLHQKGNPIFPETAQTLIDKRYVDPEDRQNHAPTNQRLVDIAAEYHDRTPFTVSAQVCGYVVPARRDDARVTFSALLLYSREGDISGEARADFFGEFTGNRNPDREQGDENMCYAWWD
jgi:hypothetical protein